MDASVSLGWVLADRREGSLCAEERSRRHGIAYRLSGATRADRRRHRYFLQSNLGQKNRSLYKLATRSRFSRSRAPTPSIYCTSAVQERAPRNPRCAAMAARSRARREDRTAGQVRRANRSNCSYCTPRTNERARGGAAAAGVIRIPLAALDRYQHWSVSQVRRGRASAARHRAHAVAAEGPRS